MKNIKLRLLNIIYGGKNLIHYKRSYHHPLISRRFHNKNYSFCVVTKVWNIKERSTCTSGHNYEKDGRIVWYWKIEIQTDLGRFILNMTDFILNSVNADGSKIKDNNLYIFYK